MMFGSRVYHLTDGNLMQQNSDGLLIYDKARNIIADFSAYYPGMKELDPILNSRQLFLFVSRYDLLFLNADSNRFDLIDIRTGKIKSFPSCINLQHEIGWQTNPVFLNGDTLVINSRNKGFFLVKVDTITRTVSCSPERYFRDHLCNTVFSDKQNRLWIGTNSGLYVENIKTLIVHSFQIEGDAKENFIITSLFLASDKIYAGTDTKKILVIDKKTKKILQQVQLTTDPVLSNRVTGFQPINQDILLVSTMSGIHWLNVKNLSSGKPELKTLLDSSFTVNFLFADKKKNIWFPTNEINSMYYYNPVSGKTEVIDDKKERLFKINSPNSIAEDNEGNIWFGGDAIARWNGRLLKIDTLIERIPTQNNWKNGYFVMSDSSGEIWAMLNDDGFAKITHTPIHIRPENILLNNKGISPALLYDKIFLATTNGLGYVDLKTQKGVIFHAADGLPYKPISSFQFVSDPTDRSTWFACENFICNISSSVSNYYMQPPVLMVSDINVINDTVINYPSERIRLGHDQNDISVSFSAINFIDPENMRFAYRINNRKDSAWIEAGNQPNILLTNISPGTYKLEMKLYAYDNKWPEQIKALEIIIQPPFWKTWWFLTIVLLVILTSIYLFYTNRIAEIRTKARIDRQMAEYEMQALHAQMNPHFIFNCLNSIREMILNNENLQASHYLSKFAHLIRITLKNSSKPFISLQNTMEYLKRYLEMEQIRKANFSYQIEVGESVPTRDIFLPPMLIQPFIENAIWHGTPGTSEVIEINIRFISENNQLVCIVEDDGIGIQASLKKKYEQQEINTDHHSVGIENVKNRIQVLNEKYDLHSRLTIEDKNNLPGYNGTGTVVMLYLAMKNTDT